MTAAAQRRPLAGFGTLLGFTLRYNWLRLVLWLLVTVGMLGLIGSFYASMAPVALEQLALGSDAPAMKALIGAISNTDPLGGKVWIKSWMFLALMLGIGMVFFVTHNRRADEDSGRTELFRSRPLGLHSSLAATLIIAVGLCVVVGVGCGAVGVSLGFGDTATGSLGVLGAWVFGASIAAIGLLGVGIGVLANELMPSSGAANGLGGGLFGLFYLMRLIGDVDLAGLAGLTWVSPVGWAEKMDPWGANRLWPLALVVGLGAVLVVAGILIEARRDYGGSLFPVKLGRPYARGSMTSVWGLAVRLQRVAWLAWAGSLAALAVFLGAVTDMMGEMMAELGFGVGSTVGYLLSMLMLGIGAFTVQSTSTMALDDTRGLLERQLAGSLTRLGWVGQRLAVSLVGSLGLLVATGLVYASAYCVVADDSSQFWPIVGTVFAYLPSLLVLIGIAALGLGWWPRLAVTISWVSFGAIWFSLIIGEVLRLPRATLESLPFISVAGLPDIAIPWPKILVTLGVGVVLVVVGLIGFRRRNIPA